MSPSRRRPAACVFVSIAALAVAASGLRAGAASSRALSPAAATDTAWTSIGTLVCDALGPRNAPAAVPDGSGGTLIVWEDSRDGTALDLYAMRLDPDGNRATGWPAGGAVVCVADSNQVDAAIAADGSGGLLVVWQDGRGLDRDIYAQHLDATGVPASGWPANGLAICPASGNQRTPAIVSDGSGGAIMAWVDGRSGADAIYAQRVLGDGSVAPGWANGGRAVCTSSGSKLDPVIASDDSGGAIIAWVDHRNGDADLYAQRVTTVGELPSTWPADGLALTLALLDQDEPAIVEDGKRGAFVAWRDGRFGDDDLYVQRVLGTGVVAAGWPPDGLTVCDQLGEQSRPRVVRDGGNGAYVCWVDARNGNDDLYATLVTKDAAIDHFWPANGKGVCVLPGAQSAPAMVPDGAGGALIAWLDARLVAPGFYAQHMTAIGDPAFGWPAQGAPLLLAGVGLTPPVIASDSAGGAVLVWSDKRGIDENVYALRFRGDAIVPVQVSVVEARAEGDRVIVSWSLSDASAGRVTVERRVESEGWESRATLMPDRSGFVRFEDGDLPAADRIGYRLLVSAGGRTEALGETWVEIPRASLLPALEGFHPNPTDRAPSVAFTLRDGAPATLEVADLAGRRLLAREVQTFGPGRHTLALPELANLPPGLYLVTLRQNGHARTARGCILR